jgi:acetyltransferase-like isoleucine patch superfamily enzyme|tara:strand:+ start:5935 stop:6468 length:534 start_codon:yes stop_codon:yes gene_type:complete
MKFNNNKLYKSHGNGSINLKKFKKIGRNVIFEKNVLIFHSENISIGDNVYIGHNSIIKGYYKNQLIIGDNTWIGQNCFLHSGGGLIIGKSVGIGPYVKILTANHDLENKNQPIIDNKIEFNKVIIKEGCDIGIGSIILPGVKLGIGSVIGAGAIVTKSVKDYSIFAGNPAKKINIRN